LIGLLLAVLIYILEFGQRSEDYDETALDEWLKEARVYRETLPGLIRHYWNKPTPQRLDAVRAHLAALGEVTKAYQAQLPLFPVVYRMELVMTPPPDGPAFVWDAHYPRWPRAGAEGRTVRRHDIDLGQEDGRQAWLTIDYQMHAFDTRQTAEEKEKQRLRWLTALAAAAVPLVGLWVFFFLQRERRREVQQLLAQQQVEHAERTALEEKLQRKEAEHQREEAERKTLELKSQLYAGIGIMAGSYAHNIKNLLVRPNDLLGRCLETDGLTNDQRQHLQEVQQTLHTVTERLQQILKTLRRDPTRAETEKLDLNAVARAIQTNWAEMAGEKWRMTLEAELSPQPLPIEGDASHLTQAVENLIFNARDSIFEMRNHLREQARADSNLDAEAKRNAIIAAAGWKGTVAVRTRRDGSAAVLEVADNGIGMTEDVRRRCVETYFSTKRDNALHQGNAAGMGLGLSFVQTVLEHHGARMEILSEPLRGAKFRLIFKPAAGS
jgi:signal transduction histidine kinase